MTFLTPILKNALVAMAFVVTTSTMFSQNQDINISDSGTLGNAALNVPTEFIITIENTHSGGNPANNKLTVTSISITGTDAAEFSITGFTNPTIIDRSGSFTFTLVFTPTSAGTKNATIEITSDDPDENSYSFDISGYGDETLTSLVLLNTYPLSVLEPSGLAFDKVNNQLFTVSDNTGLVYRISTSGTTLQTLNYTGADLEGVSMYTGNKILIAVEGTRELVEYDYVVDDGTSTSHVMNYSTTDLTNTGDNSRIEGVTYDSGNDVFYFLNEKNPGGLIKADGSFSVTDEYPLNYAGDYSGAYFVEETGYLWLTSDQESTIYKCNTDGTVEESFPITTSGGAIIDKLEGIAIDYSSELLYAVSDGGQELYVFQINNPVLNTPEVSSFQDILRVYPIPARDYINLKLPNTNKIKKVSVYNTLGETIFTDLNVQNKINVSYLKQGIYFLEVTTDTKRYTRTIAIE